MWVQLNFNRYYTVKKGKPYQSRSSKRRTEFAGMVIFLSSHLYFLISSLPFISDIFIDLNLKESSRITLYSSEEILVMRSAFSPVPFSPLINHIGDGLVSGCGSESIIGIPVYNVILF